MLKRVLVLGVMVGCGLMVGCKKDTPAAAPTAAPQRPVESTPPAEPATPTETGPATPVTVPAEPAPAPAEPAPGGTGHITGTVKWTGPAPKPRAIGIAADPYCPNARQSPLTSERLIVNDNGTLANGFVYIRSGLPERTWPIPPTPQVLDQVGCQYVPHVFGVMVGQTVTIRNSDATAHNINTTPNFNPGFNIGQPQAGMASDKVFTAPEIMVPIQCNVHPWMSAFCGIMDHPFFAVSGTDGAFTIRNVPAGTVELGIWVEHPGLASQAQPQTVIIRDGETTTVEFTFTRPE